MEGLDSPRNMKFMYLSFMYEQEVDKNTLGFIGEIIESIGYLTSRKNNFGKENIRTNVKSLRVSLGNKK